MEIPIKVVVHRSRSAGGFWAEVPGTGCVTEADTMEELRANVREAFGGWFAVTQDLATPEVAVPDEDDDGPIEVITL
jgi:predicted RNase H-like HicB family nuclease